MIQIFIADDHVIVRQGLKDILSNQKDMIVTGEASTAMELLDKIGKEDWDILILDITMPDKNGLEILKSIKKLYPKMPVLVLSMHPEDQFARRLLKAGASGYVTKDSAPELLVTAIRTVIQGQRFVSPQLAEILKERSFDNIELPPHQILSDREYEVLRLIASGNTLNEIADLLSLSVKTVSTYRTRILEKIGARTTAEMIRYALENQLVPRM